MKLVHNHPNLRKGNKGVIINVSEQERRSYRQAKQQALKQLHSQDEIAELKSELSEVKELLQQLLKNNGTQLPT